MLWHLFRTHRAGPQAGRKPGRKLDRLRVERLESRYLLNAGDLDLTFGTGGTVTTPIGTGTDDGYAVAIQPDGKIVVAGRSNNGSDYDFAVVRYNLDGSLDTSFDGDGIATTPVGTAMDEAYAIAIQSDGKIVVAGRARIGTGNDFAVVRYNSNGSLDTSFDGDGKVTSDFGGGQDEAYSLAIQTDGRIVVAGRARMAGNYEFALARYNSDGSLDTTFDSDGRVTTPIGPGTAEVRSLVIQSDGKIAAGGRASNGSNFDFALARYNAGGSLDTSFDGDGIVMTAIGGAADEIYGLVLQTDGKLVAAGRANTGSSNDFALARYNSDGSRDTSFDADGVVTTAIGLGADQAYAVAVGPNGNIIAAGLSSNGLNNDLAVVRYKSDGSLDTAFDSDGIVTTAVGGSNDEARALAIQSDRKIVLAGRSNNGSNFDFALARYEGNNTPVAAVDAHSVDEDGTLTVPASGVLGNDGDSDGDPLSAVLVTGPLSGSLTLNPDGSFTYTPNANFNGSDSFSYKANDGAADSGVATVSITVNPINDAPAADAGTDQTVEGTISGGGTVTLSGSGSDQDGDPLTYVWSDGATVLGSAASLTVNLSYGSHELTLTVTDPSGSSASDTVIVTVVDTTAPFFERLQFSTSAPTPGTSVMTGIQLTASEELDATAAADLANYALHSYGKDKRFGTADDVSLALASVTYDAATRTVQLTPVAALKQKRMYQVSVYSTAALTDLAGNQLDGDHVGGAGGNCVLVVGRGKKLTYLDSNGDKVSLSLKKAGVMDFLLDPTGEARQLRLYDTVDGVSSLTGKVTPGLGGDGIATLDSVRTPTAILNLLPTSVILDELLVSGETPTGLLLI
jgi:uncharacterized delta-60 repeat protein